MKKTDTPTLIAALEILARDIASPDGIANDCIREGAQRIRELDDKLQSAISLIRRAAITYDPMASVRWLHKNTEGAK
jgi:hypothetical protein